MTGLFRLTGFRLKTALPWLGAGAFAYYLAWQLYWLGRGQIPPSLWQVWTGWPCPSTGVCRSLHSYASGHWAEGYLFNPFTPFFMLLLGLSAVQIGSSWRREGRARITPELSRSWFLLLGLAWTAKFLLGPRFW